MVANMPQQLHVAPNDINCNAATNLGFVGDTSEAPLAVIPESNYEESGTPPQLVEAMVNSQNQIPHVVTGISESMKLQKSLTGGMEANESENLTKTSIADKWLKVPQYADGVGSEINAANQRVQTPNTSYVSAHGGSEQDGTTRSPYYASCGTQERPKGSNMPQKVAGKGDVPLSSFPRKETDVSDSADSYDSIQRADFV
ncbi:unnamed protein product [Dibothriocephalus latus]|uniref:Uncharacterized protein n=1 Tax=Dibothriocephalus latus TaxID=60516 RepID=A0A3P7P039_DIBLA|nr:unnamed protein product [Dibothriocephalus latus]